MSEPYEPPSEAPRGASGWSVAVLTWGLAGLCLGTAIGATLAMTGTKGSAGPGGIAGVVLGAIAGVIAHSIERRVAEAGPELTDARGRSVHPTHAMLLAIPLVVAMPSLGWLAFVGSVAAETPAVAIGAVFALVSVAWGGRKLLANHSMQGALALLELGQLDAGRARLEELAGSWWVTANVAEGARLNLALIALRQGLLLEATRWYAAVQREPAKGYASAGLALIAALGDRLDEANEALGTAMSSKAARAIQPEVDAVRVLVVWRAEGQSAAREVAERLESVESTALFRALLRASRGERGVGEYPGLPEPLRQVVPELA